MQSWAIQYWLTLQRDEVSQQSEQSFTHHSPPAHSFRVVRINGLASWQNELMLVYTWIISQNATTAVIVPDKYSSQLFTPNKIALFFFFIWRVSLELNLLSLSEYMGNSELVAEEICHHWIMIYCTSVFKAFICPTNGSWPTVGSGSTPMLMCLHFSRLHPCSSDSSANVAFLFQALCEASQATGHNVLQLHQTPHGSQHPYKRCAFLKGELWGFRWFQEERDRTGQ